MQSIQDIINYLIQYSQCCFRFEFFNSETILHPSSISTLNKVWFLSSKDVKENMTRNYLDGIIGEKKAIRSPSIIAEANGVWIALALTPSFLKDLAIPLDRAPLASITMILDLSYKCQNNRVKGHQFLRWTHTSLAHNLVSHQNKEAHLNNF